MIKLFKPFMVMISITNFLTNCDSSSNFDLEEDKNCLYKLKDLKRRKFMINLFKTLTLMVIVTVCLTSCGSSSKFNMKVAETRVDEVLNSDLVDGQKIDFNNPSEHKKLYKLFVDGSNNDNDDFNLIIDYIETMNIEKLYTIGISRARWAQLLCKDLMIVNPERKEDYEALIDYFKEQENIMIIKSKDSYSRFLKNFDKYYYETPTRCMRLGKEVRDIIWASK